MERVHQRHCGVHAARVGGWHGSSWRMCQHRCSSKQRQLRAGNRRTLKRRLKRRQHRVERLKGAGHEARRNHRQWSRGRRRQHKLATAAITAVAVAVAVAVIAVVAAGRDEELRVLYAILRGRLLVLHRGESILQAAHLLLPADISTIEI